MSLGVALGLSSLGSRVIAGGTLPPSGPLTFSDGFEGGVFSASWNVFGVGGGTSVREVVTSAAAVGSYGVHQRADGGTTYTATKPITAEPVSKITSIQAQIRANTMQGNVNSQHTIFQGWADQTVPLALRWDTTTSQYYLQLLKKDNTGYVTSGKVNIDLTVFRTVELLLDDRAPLAVAHCFVDGTEIMNVTDPTSAARNALTWPTYIALYTEASVSTLLDIAYDNAKFGDGYIG